MSTTIKVRKNGPYLVTGKCVLSDAEGSAIGTKENFALCRCGQSATKPFCDGAHSRTGFDDGA